MVAVVQPVTHSLVRLCKGDGQIHVETLISELPIEALHVEVFIGLV